MKIDINRRLAQQLGINPWRERIAVVLDDGVKLLSERDGLVVG
jgi:hypothetical protein